MAVFQPWGTTWTLWSYARSAIRRDSLRPPFLVQSGWTISTALRSIQGWNLGRSLEGELTLTALRRALGSARPEIHHSDQGVQYAATAYVDELVGAGASISMAAVGEPRENGYAERLMRTIKEEEVDLTEYEDFGDALGQIGRFLDEVYNRKRIHSSLGYLTPSEFEQQWISTQRSEGSTVPFPATT